MRDNDDHAELTGTEHHDHAGHVHNHSLAHISLGKWAARVVVGLLVVIGVGVVIGLIVLWPSQLRVNIQGGPQSPTLHKGTVAEQMVGDCDFTPTGNGMVSETEVHPVLKPDGGCLNSSVQITDGPDAGKWTQFSIGTQRVNISAMPGQSPSGGGSGVDTARPATPGTGQPDLKPGTKIMISENGGGVAGSPTNYAFYDYARGVSLWVWGLVFAVVIVAVAHWRGLRALLGLALSGLVIVFFALPSILDGHSAVWVAMVASSVILYVVLYLAHGVSLRTSAALLGTLSALAVCALLAWLAVDTTKVTGLSSDDATNLQAYASTVSTSGVLLAGFVIGALGVLNDVTITQASTTFELAKLSPKSSRRRTFLSAMRVGRDHIASTVYTLVFAYVGTALPLLLLFTIASRPLGQVLTSDSVAIELVRAFVGGIGLALSVPLTTAIATLLAKPTRAAVSEAAAKRYSDSHPDSDPSEIRVRTPRAAAKRAQPATTTARTTATAAKATGAKTSGTKTTAAKNTAAQAGARPAQKPQPERAAQQPTQQSAALGPERPRPQPQAEPETGRFPTGPAGPPPRAAPEAAGPRRSRSAARGPAAAAPASRRAPRRTGLTAELRSRTPGFHGVRDRRSDGLSPAGS
ncbi:YibE/F family protein [Tsukamurella sp. 1534]|uniref:YibE/F family protein n=1 Tax=Tsukamurella sp. 1534 TaxID=1151061 RepID=UPI0002FD9C3E|nr:YibE/F family protein [Tsukamurella sp. 1534]